MSDKLIALYQEIDELNAKTILPFADWWPCKSGCAQCCHHSCFSVSETEATYLIQSLTPEKRIQARRKAKKELEHIHRSCGYGNWHDLVLRAAKTRVVCPLLENDRCSVYAVRPSVCRYYGLSATMEDGKKQVYGCSTVRNAMVDHIRQGEVIVLPGFAELEGMQMLKGPLKPLVAWVAE